MRPISSLMILAAFLIALPATLLAGPQSVGDYSITKTLKIAGAGSWDYVTVDSYTHWLYLTRTTHTMVVDPANGKVVADIPGQKRSHGVALVPKLNRGFITDGQDGSVLMFDLKTNAVLHKIPAAEDADGIIYDPASDRVLVSCGDANVLLAIRPDVDPQSARFEPMQLGGKPEFLAADGAGKVYVNLVDKAQVAVVDLKEMKVISRWPVAPAANPVGMAIDPAKHHLFVGCRSGSLVILDTSDGHVLAKLPIGAVNDACALDPLTGDIFASCGDGTVTIVRETSARKFQIVQKLQTKRGAKTMGFDPSTHTAYFPAVEYEVGAQGAGRRPVAKPDSFMILVATPKGE